jgi:hypothetical protein
MSNKKSRAKATMSHMQIILKIEAQSINKTNLWVQICELMWLLLRRVVEATEHPTEDPQYYQNLCLRCQFVDKPNRKERAPIQH